MKPLKPSMKEKKRYLYIKGKNLKREIIQALYDFFGIDGLSRTCLNFIEVSNNHSIIQINKESTDQVKAGLCIWKNKIGVEKTSGTLKKLKQKIKK